MGGNQSRPPAPPPNQRRTNGKTADYFDDEEGDNALCQPCFFLGDGLRRVVKSGTHASDPIGSPVPDTPLHTRQRRQQVQAALRQSEESNKKGFALSSQYSGLEKEPYSGASSGTISADDSLVHEGPNCERELNEKYQLHEVVGVGSTSSVHRCTNKTTGKDYACKIIDIMAMEERFQGMMQQFQTEIDALQQLKHPGIIQLYDVYLTEQKIYIVMEVMEGGELFDYVVQKGTLTEEEASVIVRKVTSALVYMHAQGIVHRDLKPENLLLKQKPTGPHDSIDVKIIDFGLSKAMVEPVARTFLGTRGYLAPEMLQRRDYTRAVDTWALGVIVFVLLCGCLPFDDDSATVPSDDLVHAKFVLRFPRWAKNLSPSAKDLLSHLLCVNPRDRYTAEQALNHPWVRGETANAKSLLASPGRIRASPAVGSARRNGRKYAKDPEATPPKQTFVRKTSL